MQTCSLSVAATATASAIPAPSASSSTSSSSSSSPLFSNLSPDYLSHVTINFPFKAKPIKPPKLKSHFANYSPSSLFSRVYRVSVPLAAFDSVIEATQDEEIPSLQLPETGEDKEVQEDQEEQEVEEEGSEGSGDDDGVESLAAEERRLYVGNLPFSMTSSQLADVFAEAGRVITVEIIYDRVTDRSRGFAFVTMGSVEEAKKAIRMFEGSQIGGRTVKVNSPEVPKGGEREVMGPKIRSSYQGFIDSPHKIYAGNLSWVLTSQGLREAFSNQPGLLSAKVIYDRDSGRSRGFGFVTFSSAQDADSALNAMNGVEVEGRPLRLNLAEQRTTVSSPLVSEGNSESELGDSETLSSYIA